MAKSKAVDRMKKGWSKWKNLTTLTMKNYEVEYNRDYDWSTKVPWKKQRKVSRKM